MSTYRHPSCKPLHKCTVIIKTMELKKYNPNRWTGFIVVGKEVFPRWRLWLKKVLLFPIYQQYLISHQWWPSLRAVRQKWEGPAARLECWMAKQCRQLRGEEQVRRVPRPGKSQHLWRCNSLGSGKGLMAYDHFLEVLVPSVFGLHYSYCCTNLQFSTVGFCTVLLWC